MRKFVYILAVFLAPTSGSQWSAEASPSFSKWGLTMSRRGVFALSKSIPALSVWESHRQSSTSRTMEVAVKKRKRRAIINLPHIDLGSQLENGGFYYGITKETMTKASKAEAKKRMNLSDSMYEALEELRILRQEMEKMRKEMQSLRGKMLLDGDLEADSEEEKARKAVMQRKRAKECEKLSKEIEGWAKTIMKETEDDGWKNVECSKMLKKSLNPDGFTTAAIKWMKDSRGDKADKDDQNEYPCIRCTSTIDAPLEDVCTYLSLESASADYNDLVVKYKDVEDVSPNAKICWSQTPQILFLKPRDFVTLCHHRWKRDGTEVIVNQAWNHEDFPATKEEKQGKACRAYAIRGANIISRCPEDPEKTVMTMIAHGNPGGGVPQWAMKTAVNALAPIETFKIFSKINHNVRKNQPKLRERLQEAEMVSLPGGRSPRPAGIAQLGYACFWPNGGGMVDGQKPQVIASPQNEENGTGLDEDLGKDEEADGSTAKTEAEGY